MKDIWYFLGLPVPVQFVGQVRLSVVDLEKDRRIIPLINKKGQKALAYHSANGFEEIVNEQTTARLARGELE